MKHTFTLLNLGKSEKYPGMCVVYTKTTFLLTFNFSRDNFPPEVFLTNSFPLQILGLLLCASLALYHTLWQVPLALPVSFLYAPVLLVSLCIFVYMGVPCDLCISIYVIKRRLLQEKL